MTRWFHSLAGHRRRNQRKSQGAAVSVAITVQVEESSAALSKFDALLQCLLTHKNQAALCESSVGGR